MHVRFFFLCCVVALFSVINLSCTRLITSSGLDQGADAVVSHLEQFVPSGGNITVSAIGFEECGGSGPTENTRRLEKRINHYLSQSHRFTALEFDDDKIDKIVALLGKQSDPKYRELLSVDFANLRYIVTGAIDSDDGGGAEIQARLVSLQDTRVLGSTVVPVALESSLAVSAFWWLLLAGALLVGLIFIKKLIFPRFHKTGRGAAHFVETACASCGAKIKDVYQQGGTCTNPTCENKLCSNCWNVKRLRKCNECSAMEDL